MQIETYEIEDASSDASAMANDAAALELIESLGLTGQKSLLNKDTVTRVPYRVMEMQEMLVYKALCDRSVPLEEYKADCIPVRVLQAAAYARQTEMFHRLMVWYPSEARIDDPVLIGIKKDFRYPSHPTLSDDVFYLIARWGKTLLPFEQLEAMATKMLKTRRQTELAKAFAEVKIAMASLEDTNDLRTLSAQVSFSC